MLIKRKISKNENPDKVFDIVEKVTYSSKQQKGKVLKILIPKQMCKRLPIALASVKAGNRSGNLKNEIHQIIYYLYQAKAITKSVYDNILN